MAKKITRTASDTKGGLSAKAIIGVIIAGLFISIGSVMYGRADEGAINVAEVINHSNIAAKESGNEGDVVKNPTANRRSDAPNGGLVGTGEQEEQVPQAQPEPAVEGATTTTDGGGGSDTDDEAAETASNEADSEAATTTEDTVSSED